MNSNQGTTPKGNNHSKYKEFYKNSYYIKIEVNNSQEISFIIYNIELLDSIKYQIKLQLKEFYYLSKTFKMYDTIEEIFNVLIELINNNNYEINKDTIRFIIADVFQKRKEIEMKLNKEDDNNEYLKILSKEIKNKNDIIKNLQDNYNNLKNEIKEMKNLINKLNDNINNSSQKDNKSINNNINQIKNNNMQINEKIEKKLNINNKKEEDLYKKLYDFNNNFGLYLNNYNATELDFKEEINTSNIKYLNTVKLPLVKKINCKIIDLNLLQEFNFKDLEELKISFKSPDNINILENINFSKLKVLDLSNNKFYEINALEKVNFKDLRELNLSNI